MLATIYSNYSNGPPYKKDFKQNAPGLELEQTLATHTQALKFHTAKFSH